MTKGEYLTHTVRNHDESRAVLFEFVDLVGAFFAERNIAHAEHFVYEHKVGIDVHRYGEPQTRDHAGRVVLERRVDEVAQLRKFDYTVILFLHFAVREPHHCAVEEYVFLAGCVGVEPRAEFEKRYDVAFGEHYAAGGAYDAGDDLEQGGFTRAVAPDKREAFAAFHAEIYVFQHVEALVSDLELQQFDGIFLEVVYALGGHAELHGHAARVHEHFRAFAELFD